MTDLTNLKAGELLTLAITEARQYPPEMLDMTSWVEVNDDGSLCSVCLAGAVMLAQHPDVAPEEILHYVFIGETSDVYSDIKNLRRFSINQRFIDTAANREAIRNIPTSIGEAINQSNHEPWINDWAALAAFADYLTANNI